MIDAPPLPFVWDADCFRPLPRFLKKCQEYFGTGEVVTLVAHNERSRASHNSYFASIHEAWQQLPEKHGDRFPSPESLRKWALVKAGYCDIRTIVTKDAEQAQNIAALCAAMDEYAIVDLKDNIAVVYTPRSQSYKAMDKKDFQASKKAVLDIIAGMIGVSSADLTQAASK